MLLKPINRVIIFFFALLSFILLKCANQLPPTGGDVDRIPPEVVEVYPEPGTVNYDDDYFEVEFSEYVDKRSVKEAVFISPFIEEALDFDWSGTTVTVTFPEGLKKDITYTITIGTDVVDYNNKNRMSNAYTFSFSTGDRIDKKYISGKVYGDNKEGILIYAYKLAGGIDTLLNRKPDYVSQTGADGSFVLNGLATGNYRVFAVDDKFRDLLFQPEQDWIGVPNKDIPLIQDSMFTNLSFQLFNADTSKPRLISSVMTDRNHILLSFSSEIDTSVIKSSNFSLIDSTENSRYKITYAFKGQTKPEELVLVTPDSLPVDNRIFVNADTLENQLGNITVNDYSLLTISDKPDTSSVGIKSTLPSQNGTVDFVNPELKFYFDDAFGKEKISEAISFADTLGKKVRFSVEYEDDATMVLKPKQDLKPEKDYRIEIDLSYFPDAAGNRRDSIYKFSFSTINGLDFTGLSGNIFNADQANNPVIILMNADDKNKTYKQKLINSTFEFERVEAGKYLLWCFFDRNENNIFDNGWYQPIEFSEKFSFYPDTLNLRPRWEITDIKFNFR